MRYQNVCLESIAYTLPDEIVSSAQIEAWLEPLYRRLRLPEGRLELMTGIIERRFWPRGTQPGKISVQTAEEAIRRAGIDKRQFGALVHGSVCRDFLEPATACGVHQRVGLPSECQIYDVSNACLGLLNGVIQVANMIELGQIRAAVVVGTESARSLVETTIQRLNTDASLTRNDIKLAVASLTIGSGSAAIVLSHRELSRSGNRLLGGVVRTNTQFCHLCQSDRDDSPSPRASETRSAQVSEARSARVSDPTESDDAGGDSMSPLMWTDSEALMHEGVLTAKAAFGDFLATVGWQPDSIDKTFCHQVGRVHRKLLFEAIGLDPAIDFTTLDFLGNTGSVALPMTAALGIERGHVSPGDHVALMGIGSGINVLMLGVQWGGASQG